MRLPAIFLRLSSPDSFLGASLVVLALSNLGHFFQLLTQVLTGRLLGPADFGVFNSVSSIVMAATSLTMVVTNAAAKELIGLGKAPGGQRRFYQVMLGRAALGSGVLALGLTLLARPMAAYLKLEDLRPMYICAGTIFVLYIMAFLNGMLQGLLRHRPLSMAHSLNCLLRLVFVLLLVGWLGLGYNGALAASLLGFGLALAYYFPVISRALGPAPAAVELPAGSQGRMLRESLGLALMWTYLSVIGSVDSPLVKHFLSDYETGVYSVAAVLGRIALFIPSFFLYMLFPEVVKSESEGRSAARKTMLLAGLTLAVSGGFAAVVNLAPGFIVTRLFGEAYASAAGLARVISCSMALLAVLCVVFNYFAARGRYGFLCVAYAVFGAMIAAVYAAFHDSGMQVALVFLAGVAATLALSLGWLVLESRRVER